MKKIIFTLILFVMVFSCVCIVGCNSDTVKIEKNTPASEPTYDDITDVHDKSSLWILPDVPFQFVDHIDYEPQSDWELPCVEFK